MCNRFSNNIIIFRNIIIFILSLASLKGGKAQTLFIVDSTNYCSYNGDITFEELYHFKHRSDTFEYILGEILQKVNADCAVDPVWTNIPSIASVISGGSRSILYSRKYLLPLINNEDDEILIYALFSHALGHHVNGHLLTATMRDEEENDADEFMGYVLALFGFSAEDAALVPERIVQTKGLTIEDRKNAILRGYRKADASLRSNAHAAYYEENVNVVIQSFPKFDIPPPAWSAEADVGNYFEECNTLYDADRRIRNALDATGYYSRRYFRVENGFAIVTKLEQFNADGSRMKEQDRWNSKPVRADNFSIVDYLYSLFAPTPGYFRVIVFIVSPESYSAKNSNVISREEAISWLNEGRNRLPDAIGNQPFLKNKTTVSALIYEFTSRESDNKLYFRETSNLSGMIHLNQSKIIEYLAKQ